MFGPQSVLRVFEGRKPLFLHLGLVWELQSRGRATQQLVTLTNSHSPAYFPASYMNRYSLLVQHRAAACRATPRSFFRTMIPELRGRSLARQYPCLGLPQLSHHLSKPSDVRPDKEQRRQNIRGRHPAALAYPPPARLADNYPRCFG